MVDMTDPELFKFHKPVSNKKKNGRKHWNSTLKSYTTLKTSKGLERKVRLKSKPESKERKDAKAEAKKRSNDLCLICGKEYLKHNYLLHCHHVLGREDVPENLVVLCWLHHTSPKGIHGEDNDRVTVKQIFETVKIKRPDVEKYMKKNIRKLAKFLNPELVDQIIEEEKEKC